MRREETGTEIEWGSFCCPGFAGSKIFSIALGRSVGKVEIDCFGEKSASNSSQFNVLGSGIFCCKTIKRLGSRMGTDQRMFVGRRPIV
jgi:hypothetical protein